MDLVRCRRRRFVAAPASAELDAAEACPNPQEGQVSSEVMRLVTMKMMTTSCLLILVQIAQATTAPMARESIPSTILQPLLSCLVQVLVVLLVRLALVRTQRSLEAVQVLMSPVCVATASASCLR